MSRGLGKVQRAILQELRERGFVMVREMTDLFLQPSVSRATKRLYERGLINVWYKRLGRHWRNSDFLRTETKAIIVSSEIDTPEKFKAFCRKHKKLQWRDDDSPYPCYQPVRAYCER